jgi:polyphosphate kinase
MEQQNRYFNRELSWIEFNARVLSEALRKEIPLLERLQFLSIVSSNFDEFFQVRVASIKRQLKNDPRYVDSSGLTPDVVLRQISARCHQIMRIQHSCLVDDVLPELADKGVVYVTPAHFSMEQKGFTQNFFQSTIFPLLTPLRIDTDNFPMLGNLRLHAAFLLKRLPGVMPFSGAPAVNENSPMIAVVQIPSGIPRILWLPDSVKTKSFALIDDIVTQYGTQLFPGFSVEETMLFKVTRDADFAVDEDSGSNFINAMEEVLVQRQSSFAVRLMCNRSSATILAVLTKKLELLPDDVYQLDGIMDPSNLLDINQTEDAEKFHYPEWQHFYPADLPVDDTYWDTFKQRDVLLHVPYESYQPVIKLISDAADDPKVLAIKMTLYRTGLDSPIVAALERAANNGKQVTCFVELKARFDEERNIAWASQLEKAGVIVIYGIVNYKVHAKILMIMRRENGIIRRYVHLSTGNYNPKTAKLYSDLSLFTTNQEIANDATIFFNIISGYSAIQSMKHLSMAPVNLKSKILAMIQREIDRSTPDNPGLIIAKMNSLSHEEVIAALYRASCAGVHIELNVRGICTLIPGVPGMSENIKIVSIVDRYLEHTRIFYFRNGGSAELYLSSADWMPRNLDRRVELMFPVIDRKIFREVFDILKLYFTDNTHSHLLKNDGSWAPSVPGQNEQGIDAQDMLYRKYKRRADRAAKEPEIEFKVRRKN